MAPPPPPPPRQHKAADIDTAPPFQNVKAAVRMFGEKGVITSHSEKHGATETERRKLEEELAKARAQLVDAQKDRANALSEVEDLKKCVKANQFLVSGVDCFSKEECRDEKHAALENELKLAKEQHAVVLEELQVLKKETSILEQKLYATLQEKEKVARQAEEALSAAEVNAKRAEELSNEISGTKESLLLVRMACIEANNEREALLAARNGTSSELTHTESTIQSLEDSVRSPNSSNKLDIKLKADRDEISKEELRELRHNLVAVRRALANIDKLKAGCRSPVTDATISIELAAAKAELSKALENGALIESTMKELQDKFKEVKQELEATKTELAEVRNRDMHAITLLKSELEKTQEELKVAVSCNEAFVGLSHKLQNLAVFEEEESGAQAEDVLKCKVLDEAKAELHALLKEEAEAVRQAELRQKTCGLAQHSIEAAYKAKQDNLMDLSKNEDPNSFSNFDGESVANALESWMRTSYKEEPKKKKKLPLPSFSALLSRSKRGSRKATIEDA